MYLKSIDVAFHGISNLDSKKLGSSRLARSTLVVDEDSSAIDTARLVEKVDARLVVVIGPGGGVRGVIFPKSVVGRMQRIRGSLGTDFPTVIEEFARDPAEAKRGFHHEWLNAERPDMYWCVAGQHYVDRCPCDEHRASPCRPD